MSRKSRRNFSGSEKVSILKRHLVDRVSVSDLCDEYGLQPTVFYRWQKQFFENGERAFERRKDGRRRKSQDAKMSKLEDKLKRKNEVLSELMEEHIALKKSLGEI